MVVRIVVILAAAAVLPVAVREGPPPPGPARLEIDYPLDDSVFPPEFPPPAFLWRDPSGNAARWFVEVEFRDGAPPIRISANAGPPPTGEIDPRAVAPANTTPSPDWHPAGSRSWTPPAELWDAIKRHSVRQPATLTISGIAADRGEPVCRGSVSIRTSIDPVGAPVFYRDVPLMPSELKRGVIKPLAAAGIPLIAWRLRYAGETRARLLLEGLHSCTNCHSFSLDGKVLGMDVDGPENDKGTYAIVPVVPQVTIRNEDVITWNSFPGKLPSRPTIGFLSQVSPDGRYVVSTVNEELYVANFKDYRFLQVFYPTRGVLAWYNRATREMKALPGADDPRYVHTDAVWSPDGEYLVFARAEAKSAYPPGQAAAQSANDPNEIPMQYGLCRIPFNNGRGGRPVPIAGASHNGMSNSFPKVSPDGRWIVFVKSRNGQLLRPDGELYIVPAGGGQARRMRCNTPLMNSWHSFSPNGRWMVFSSKSRSPYTRMFLTHIDEQGNDSPAILIENATAANRAVNIPEFLNIPPGGLERIEVPAAEFYRLFDTALELGRKGDHAAAIVWWEKALAIDPGNAKARTNLGIALWRGGARDKAIAAFRQAVALSPNNTEARNNLGAALVQTGMHEDAIRHFQVVLKLDPGSAETHNNLAVALLETGRNGEAIPHFEKVLEANPGAVEVHDNLGRALARQGRLDEAVVHWRAALAADPSYAEAHFNLGDALYAQGKSSEALAHLRQALAVAAKQGNKPLADALRKRIALYETGTPSKEAK